MIDTIAIGDVAVNTHRFAGQVADGGSVCSGVYDYLVTSASATDLSLNGTVAPFGNARLEGRFSSEGTSATNADGTLAEFTGADDAEVLRLLEEAARRRAADATAAATAADRTSPALVGAGNASVTGRVRCRSYRTGLSSGRPPPRRRDESQPC